MPLPDAFRAPVRTSLTFLALVACAGSAWSQETSKTEPRRELPAPRRDLPEPRRELPAPRRELPAPDPVLFDGTDFPPEERPERGLYADFEAGEEEAKSAGDPERQEAGGGGEEEEGGGAGSVAGAGGGQEGATATADAGAGGSGTSDDADAAANGPEGAGAAQAPTVAAAADQTLVKPGEMPLGDPNARIAQSPEALRQPPPGAPVSNQQGEDRMSVKSASGQQTPNRSRGSERGIEIPSSL